MPGDRSSTKPSSVFSLSLSLPSFCVFGLFVFWVVVVVCSIIRRRRRGLYIRFDCVTETAVEKYDETSREGGQQWSWCQQDSRPALTLTETNFDFISFLFHKNRREIERGKNNRLAGSSYIIKQDPVTLEYSLARFSISKKQLEWNIECPDRSFEIFSATKVEWLIRSGMAAQSAWNQKGRRVIFLSNAVEVNQDAHCHSLKTVHGASVHMVNIKRLKQSQDCAL